MNVTMTREEVCEVLGVKESTLRDIVKNKKLYERLLKNGFELICKHKHGRNVCYEVKPVGLDYWDQVQNHYNVKKKEEHDNYTIARLTNDGVLQSRSSLLRNNNIDICGTTARKFDEILENEGIIMKDKTVYALYNKTTGEFTEITEDGYKSFWKDVSFCKELLFAERRKLNRREISQDLYDYRSYTIIDQVGREKGEIAIMFDTYKELQDTRDLIDLIKNKLKNGR